MPTPHLLANAYLQSNILSSVEAWLNQWICVPYNAAVASTQYAKTMQILVEYPDDMYLESSIPAIVLCHPEITKPVQSTGAGDALVWNFVTITMDVYPGLNVDSNGTTKPVLKPVYILRSLFQSLSTLLTIPLTDFTTLPNPTLVDYAYLDNCTIIDTKGAVNTLALNKHKFSCRISFRHAVPVLSGA